MLQARAAGVAFFQYRNKTTARRTVYEAAFVLARTARSLGALFLVNDHADIAAAVDADGVHLGQDDLPIEQARKILGRDKIIGISTHSREQAHDAERSGADYIGFGPVFSTSTKDAGEAQGIEKLACIRQEVTLPVIAIGGINRTNIREVVRAGADGVAVISAVLSTENIRASAESMVKLLRDVRRDT
jgi:thiamine-phosphate pyrophosphorylase